MSAEAEGDVVTTAEYWFQRAMAAEGLLSEFSAELFNPTAAITGTEGEFPRWMAVMKRRILTMLSKRTPDEWSMR